MKSASMHTSSVPYAVQTKRPQPFLQRVANTRLQPSDPLSVTAERELQRVAAPWKWGWLAIVALLSALGIAEIAYVYTAARFNGQVQDYAVWPGFLLLFVPCAVRLLSPRASRRERIGLLCIFGLALYCAALLFEPLRFTPYDGFLHWRTLSDIMATHHLFSFNSMLPVSPYYPGLEIATDALSTLSGLNAFAASLIVLALARLIMVLALFLLYECALDSPWMAGIATLIYMTNPHFLVFDAQFAYESLALPLATLMFCALAYLMKQHGEKRFVVFLPALLLGAVVITHHMTDFVSDGFLCVWLLVALWQRRGTGLRQGMRFITRSPLALLTLLALAASIIDIALIGNPVVQYLTSYYASALRELGAIITHTSGARQLFVSYSGQPTPIWERLLTASSIALIVLAIPFGLYSLWRRYRDNTLLLMFGVLTLGYPASQVFRFTNFGTEITDRAAAFLFIPLSCILTLALVRFWPAGRLNWKHSLLFTSLLSVLFLGGIIIGSGPPWGRLPGSYMVAADERSVEPEGIETALWAKTYLGADRRIAADRTNQFLMSACGDQLVVNTLNDFAYIPSVFLTPTFDADVQGIIRQTKIHYLVVDQRMSTALPGLGFYYETIESGAFQHKRPVSSAALAKFNTVAGIDRVFDSGDIVIYDTGGLLHAPEKP